MDISKYLKPRFIKKEDCQPPLRLTITGAEEKTYSGFNEDAKDKVIIDLESKSGEKFRHSLNDVNLRTIAKAFGTETGLWTGKDVILRHDPDVKMQGEIVGGIRVVIPAGDASKPPTLKRKRDRMDESSERLVAAAQKAPDNGEDDSPFRG